MCAELHAHSNFSFLEGASHIEELVLRARELGYESLTLSEWPRIAMASVSIVLIVEIHKLLRKPKPGR